MKKIIAIILAIVAFSTTSAVVYARNLEFHDGVYRGEKWNFNFGKPNKNNIIILPPDRPEPKAYGNGYVGHMEISEKEYEIILLGQ